MQSQYEIEPLVARIKGLIKGKLGSNYKLKNTDSNNDLIQICIDLTKERHPDINLLRYHGDFSVDLKNLYHRPVLTNLFMLNYKKDGTVKFRMDDVPFAVTSQDPGFSDLPKLYWVCNQTYCKNGIIEWLSKNCNSFDNVNHECAFKAQCDFYKSICSGLDHGRK